MEKQDVKVKASHTIIYFLTDDLKSKEYHTNQYTKLTLKEAKEILDHNEINYKSILTTRILDEVITIPYDLYTTLEKENI